jgi:CRISPR-associated protein Csm3
MADLRLIGRIFITGEVRAITGLHIGGSEGLFSIGGVDNTVIVDPITQQPYIPGSSLRGKMRSLLEKYEGKVTGQTIQDATIHQCKSQDEYNKCPICNLFGVPAGGSEKQLKNKPTRLVVRDIRLTDDSVKRLLDARTMLQYTEVKTEVSIDRVTSQAVPRQIERVPAGAIFGPMTLIVNVYQEQDVDWVRDLVKAMSLLEDDYLGGSGSRGSGQVRFEGLKVTLKAGRDYKEMYHSADLATVETVTNQLEDILSQIKQHIAQV